MATAGSEDLYDLACQPCQLDGQLQEAVGLCTDCQDYLCQNCFDVHTLPIPSRNHELLTKDQMLNSQISLKRKDKCTEKCNVHEDEFIKFYCINHCKLGCSVCISLDHRTCDSVRYIPQEARDLANNVEFTQTETRLKLVEERCKKITAENYQPKIEALQLECSEAVNMVHQFRNEINDTVDNAETDLVTKCESLKTGEMEEMGRLFNQCKSVLAELHSQMELKETYRVNEQNCKLYTTMMNLKDQLKSAEDKLNECETGLAHVNIQIKFVANKETLDALKHADALGNCTGTESLGIPQPPSDQKNKEQAGSQPQMTNVSSSKGNELHRAKNAWKPATMIELYKKTRSILNKLTRQKFQTLVSQMQALPIDSEIKLKGVIDLVFEKAISEPKFSVAYANMCRCLSMFKVVSKNKQGEMVNFRALLLTRCQREFEKDKSSEALFKEKREEIAKTEPGQKRDELEEELEYEESKVKGRSLGNIRFLGELFRLKMLTENIMHDCVFKLLRAKDPKNLECLCTLLTTIGKELDVDKAKPRMDQYFQEMQMRVNKKKVYCRVRFMLQDVIDLRLNKWVPRRVDNNPKTIDQIHKEVQQEAQEKALLAQQAQLAKHSHHHVEYGGRRGPPGQIGGGNDGWNTVGGLGTPLKSVDRSIDPSKIKFSKQNVDESSIQLHLGDRPSIFAGRGRGSTVGNTSLLFQKKKNTNTSANRLSAEGAQRDRSRGRELDKPEQPATMAPADPAVKELTADEMEKKTKVILDEFLHIQDFKEAILCVKELSANNHNHFVYNAINHVIERSTVDRRQTGHLLHDLVKENVITSASYLKGLLELLEFAEDMEIDIPKIWQFYGELISPIIQDGSVPLNFLKEMCQPLLTSNKAGILLAEVLHDASHREGHKTVAGWWLASGLQWSDFVPKHLVQQFLKEKDLEFTKGGDSVPTTPTTGLPLQEIADKLHMLIVSQSADNEAVFDWIESNVDEPTTKQPKFIRALMTAVCNSAIKGEKGKERVEPKDINNRNDLLQKYLDHQSESELQALYALQTVVSKLEHPPGVLRHMFDTLYDEDIISEDAFIQWEKSEDEPDGKGASLKQVRQFFTWLREAINDI